MAKMSGENGARKVPGTCAHDFHLFFLPMPEQKQIFT